MERVWFITGASRGFGRAFTEEAVKRGDKVIATVRRVPHDDIFKHPSVLTVVMDVTKTDEVEKAIKDGMDRFGRIDVLINNAGIAQIKLFTDITPEEWRQMFAANVDGVYHCCRAAVPHLVRQHSGAIVNVSSIWGLCGASCETHYSAAKAAVIGFTQALAKELAPSGVTVNCVAPGAIDTEMNAHLSPEERRALEEEIPLGRMGTPEEAAAAIAFLAGEDARYFTGQVLSPNGGIVI